MPFNKETEMKNKLGRVYIIYIYYDVSFFMNNDLESFPFLEKYSSKLSQLLRLLSQRNDFLVCLFYGILTFVGYLMPNLFLYK